MKRQINWCKILDGIVWKIDEDKILKIMSIETVNQEFSKRINQEFFKLLNDLEEKQKYFRRCISCENIEEVLFEHTEPCQICGNDNWAEGRFIPLSEIKKLCEELSD